MKKITIAIDGFSSTGKSTIAKQLAKKLNYSYIDTGAMYRAFAYFALEHQLISEKYFDIEEIVNQLKNIQLHFEYNVESQVSEIYLNGKCIENEIRTLNVSNYVSKVAEIAEVRSFLVDQQKEMGKNKGVILDGRDIGTVVFPDAELKLFMTALPEIRAQRRYEELIAKGEKVEYEAVLKNLTERDLIDAMRKVSPLKKALDAVEIDNSHLTMDEQLEKIYQLSIEKIKL